MLRTLRGLAFVGVLLWPGRAAAVGERWRLSAAVGAEQDLVSDRAHPVLAATVAAPLARDRLEARASARFVTGHVSPDPALGLALGLSLCARQGWYHPAVGVELEARTPYRSRSADAAVDSLVRAYEAAGRNAALFARVVVEPARARWGPWFVAAASLRLGTPLTADAGRRLQIAVNVLELGFSP